MGTEAVWSRRSFVKAAGTAAGALVLGFTWACRDEPGGSEPAATVLRGNGLPGEEGEPFEPNAWVHVYPSGAVALTVHRSEMGQGVRTSCAMLLAEELEVSLDQVRIRQAEGDERFGNQNTDGSTTVRLNFESLREAGAAARTMLVAAAAQEWGVAAPECTARAGRVHHEGSGRSVGYGEVAAVAATLDPPAEVTLKSATQWGLIGTPRPSLDLGEMVTGRAVYGADVQVDGMRTAVLARAPTRTGRAVRFDREAALAVPGVREVVEIPADPNRVFNAAIAVVADHTWAALQGREALAVEWDAGAEASENSEAFGRALEGEVTRPGRRVVDVGDVDAAFAGSARALEATYHGPHLVHAPMEPMALVAHAHDGTLDVWAPTQHPVWARDEAARVSGLAPENVTVNVTLLGGGFGRKSKPDFVAEAAALATRVEGPVRIQWTREDEMRHGWYRAQNCQYLRATLDADGAVTSWLHRTAFPPISSSFDPAAVDPGGGELGQGATNLPYRIPNVAVEAGRARPQVRIGWLRSVCNTFHARAIGCFMDELAEAAGRDPAAYLLEMLGEPRTMYEGTAERPNPYPLETGRLSAAIRRVMDESGWSADGPPPAPAGQAWGIAAHYSFYTYVCTAVRAGLENGRPVVHEVHTAVDCGTVINPDTVRAQMEGAVVFALSYALYGRITVDGGVVQEGNFDTYPLLRMNEMPTVHVHLIESEASPTGVGEPGVPPVPPALLNALYRVTGRRVYDLPLSGQELV